MAIEQQADFLQQIPPFERLEASTLMHAALTMDVVYFPAGELVPLTVEVPTKERTPSSNYLYFVIKGSIAEERKELRIGRYHVRGYFGEHAILASQQSALNSDREKRAQVSASDSVFRVLEEAILYRMPAEVFLGLLEASVEFQQYFNASIVEKLNAMHQAVQAMTSTEVMMDTVCSAPILPLVMVNDAETLQTATQEMVKNRTDACVVALSTGASVGDERQKPVFDYGIVTSTDILRLVASGQTELLHQSLADSNLANAPLHTVHQYDYLFNALLKMTRFQIDRLVVRSDTGLVGFLHLKDLMSLFANQSGLALLKVDQATSVNDLRAVAQQVELLVENLNRKGIKTHYIAKLVNELHRKMIQKLVQFFLPETLHSQVSLIVMGSEGRAEQVVRTDQDNALLFADGLSEQEQQQLTEFATAFTQAMIAIGFPPCPGNIMLSNPVWRQSISQFSEQLRGWFDEPSSESFMYISIVFDAALVHGNAQWLSNIKHRLQQRVTDNPLFLRHFAKAVLQFETPVSFFGGLRTDKTSGIETIDLKKGGIFPIVHGVRCYALQSNIEATNTHWRIKALMDLGVFEESFGVELGETLNFLNTLRLESMLQQLSHLSSSSQSMGAETENVETRAVADNDVDISRLSHLQQDLLKQSMRVVDAFKKRVTKHFKLHELL